MEKPRWMQHLFQYGESDDEGISPAGWLTKLLEDYDILRIEIGEYKKGLLLLVSVQPLPRK